MDFVLLHGLAFVVCKMSYITFNDQYCGLFFFINHLNIKCWNKVSARDLIFAVVTQDGTGVAEKRQKKETQVCLKEAY